MRPIHLAEMEQRRPVVILTRETVRSRLRRVTIAPITTNVRGLTVEVAVDEANGLDGPSVVNCDNATTIPVRNLGPQIGVLLDHQEPQLAAAIVAAFDLDVL
jgi:mRNA interferase MazF